jgi:protein TonB
MGPGVLVATLLHLAVAVAIVTWPGVMPTMEPVQAVEIVFSPPALPAQSETTPEPVAKPVARPAPVAVAKPAHSVAPQPFPSPSSQPAEADSVAEAATSTTAPASAAPAAAPVAASGPEVPDTPPAGLDMPRPNYPRMAKQRGWQGLVVVAVEVNELGCANSVTVKQSSGHAMLDEAAMEAARRWHFRPARKDGRDVTASVEIPIRFSLTET